MAENIGPNETSGIRMTDWRAALKADVKKTIEETPAGVYHCIDKSHVRLLKLIEALEAVQYMARTSKTFQEYKQIHDYAGVALAALREELS